MARITLQTVADQVGVSRTTVSNAYNRPDQLTDELRSRIFDAAAKLGYRGPDAAARMLRTGKMGTIGLLFQEDLHFVFTDPNTMLFMQGVAETSALAGTGLTLLPVPVGSDVNDTALPKTAVDGYLVFSVPRSHPALESILRREKPIVVVDEPNLEPATSFVGVDDRAGARIAADHLLGLGHRKIGVVLTRLWLDQNPGPRTRAEVENADVRIARDRLHGYLDALEAHDLDRDSYVIWEAGGNDPDCGREAVKHMLSEHPELTALLCFSDQLAIGAAQAGGRSGRVIPDELSIMGFDDVPRAATWDPPLSTIRQPLVDKGRAAAELLMQQIADGGTRRVELDIELIVRSSTTTVPSNPA